METPCLGFVLEHRKGSRVHPDDGVEIVRNGGEGRLGCGAESCEESRVLIGEANVAPQLCQQRKPSLHVRVAYHIPSAAPVIGALAAWTCNRCVTRPALAGASAGRPH